METKQVCIIINKTAGTISCSGCVNEKLILRPNYPI
jgi:hypothetical protein